MFLLAQSSVPWHRQRLNSLSHLDIFILMKTAINFATQTPTFMETQNFLSTSWLCSSLAVPIDGGSQLGAGKGTPLRGCPPSARPSALVARECHTGMKRQVWGGEVPRLPRASSLASRVKIPDPRETLRGRYKGEVQSLGVEYAPQSAQIKTPDEWEQKGQISASPNACSQNKISSRSSPLTAPDVVLQGGTLWSCWGSDYPRWCSQTNAEACITLPGFVFACFFLFFFFFFF